MTDRVVLVCTQMEAGGVQIRATQMRTALARNGHSAKVVFLYKKRATFEQTDDVVVLFGIPPRWPGDYLLIVFRLFAYFLREKPTGVIGFAHFASPLSALAAAVVGCKRRIATQTNPSDTMPTMARLMDLLCGTLGVYTDNICASDTVLNSYASYPHRYRKRLRVVYNGVDLRPSLLTKSMAKQALGFQTSKLLLVSCGRLSRQKNHSFLLPILASLPHVSLVIAGDGELRTSIENEAAELGISDRLILTGELPPESVRDVLRAADVFLFPSLYEAFGLALVEAMAQGAPVITSDHAALREIVSDGGLSLPLDQRVWIETIASLLANEKERLALSTASRRRSQSFGFPAMLAGFEKAVLSRSSKPR